MLSILIPTYNYNCSELITGLAEQALQLKKEESTEHFDYEILVGDDASTDIPTIDANKEATLTTGGRYIRVPRNIGRASMRNTLARQATGKFILFIDCDARLCTKTFLKQYWHDRDRADVVCGALKSPDIPPPVGHELRYRYEIAAAKRRSADYRNAHSYMAFTTFNVMFRREVFLRTGFDERCIEYGYEDALLGLTLQQNGISVWHTDNALIHDGIDSNTSFLQKTEASLRTLSQLKGAMQQHAGASRAVQILNRFHLRHFTAYIFGACRQALWRQLSGKSPSLFLFKLYKIGYYAQLCEKRMKTQLSPPADKISTDETPQR